MVALAHDVDHRDNQSHGYQVEGQDPEQYCRILPMAAGHDEHDGMEPIHNYDHLVVVVQVDADQVARVGARNKRN